VGEGQGEGALNGLNIYATSSFFCWRDDMRCYKGFIVQIILFFGLASVGFAEDFDLQYFLARTSSKESELSRKERAELLTRIGGAVEQAQRIHKELTQAIHGGEVQIGYQEGRFWMSKLEEDRGSIETGIQQLKFLKEKPTDLLASIKLYKSLRDLSSNLSAYNNTSLFSAFVGDLAPEMELWVDPVFYRLYLLPLARSKDTETEPPKKEKPPIPKEKKP
jgi:hypothetical protein